MVRWHHRLNGNEFEQIQGDSEGQESLVCFSSRGCKESDMTQQLNNECVGSQLPDQEMNMRPLEPALKGGFLITGPPVKSS